MNCRQCNYPMMPVFSERAGWQEVCLRCGHRESAAHPRQEEQAAKYALQGQNYYALQRFEKAMESFRMAAQQSDDLPEYLWALLLAKYGVKYCKADNSSGGYEVNFWRRELPEGFVREDALFAQLCDAVAMEDPDALRDFNEAAEDIDRALHQIRKSPGDDCDVFICYKDTDANGGTPERELCVALYNELRDRGVKLFFAPKTLYGKFTTDYEGYIYTALRRAKLLLVVTSSRENVTSPWVASEWRRFQRWNDGEDYRLLTCMVGDMRPTDFPPELSRYQHELRAELDQLEELPTVKWIAGEIMERLRFIKERKPQSAKLVEPIPEASKRPMSELELLISRAERGEAQAQFDLGERYYNGTGVTRDLAEAAKWYRRSAEQGHVRAQNVLGYSYKHGEGVERDMTEAAKWFRKAAEQGYAKAQCNLGNCYDKGQGVKRDKAEAAKWYRRAAEQGYAPAQFNLGLCYDSGKGVSKDKAEAAKWYRRAAEQGNVRGQYNLGTCYENGRGVEKDWKEAAKWYRKAADQGSADAQYKVGFCYDMGYGVEEDKEEARKWYRKAAEQGDVFAKFNLWLTN